MDERGIEVKIILPEMGRLRDAQAPGQGAHREPDREA
jgi:hypothetical protein